FQTPAAIGSAFLGQIAVGDFNGDQKPDVFTSNFVFLGIGNGAFSSKAVTPPSNPLEIQATDFNGDNKTDVLVVSLDNFQAYVGYNDGAANFTFSQIPSIASAANATVGDVTNDGKPDIIISNNNNQNVSILVNKSPLPGFSEVSLPVQPTNARSTCIGDFDGDGKMDIAVASQVKINIYLQGAGATFTEFNALSLTEGTLDFLVPTDFDNDLKQDILVFSLNNTYGLSLLLNDFTKKPTVAPTALAFTNVTGQSAKMSFTKGNGNGRIFIAREAIATDAVPTDGVFYSANNGFGNGSEITSTSFVIARGDSSSYTINKLKSNTVYFISAFEYNSNQKSTIIDYFPSPVTASFKTDFVTGLEDPFKHQIILYPNPADGEIYMTTETETEYGDVTIRDMRGLKLTVPVSRTDQVISLNVRDLAPGLYVLTAHGYSQKFIKR
ncbi:MAG TPA: T9SS type A sorting domain-containing protein, partial [Cyclobacteriaceae bacterium]|nr:T9SS type A sorting domain-containing protein [Cyclobacteriaceae bacterium]